MPSPHDHDPNDATIVPSTDAQNPDRDRGSPATNEAEDSVDVTLFPGDRSDAATDSQVRMRQLLDHDSDTTVPPPSVEAGADSSVVQLTPNRSADSSGGSRSRLNQLLDRDEHELDEATLPPPHQGIPVDREQTLLPPTTAPASDEATQVQPESQSKRVLDALRRRAAAKQADKSTTVAINPTEPTLLHQPSTDQSRTQSEGTLDLPGASVTTPESEVTRSLTEAGSGKAPQRPFSAGKGSDRYAVQALHAKGGLGEVYTARDTELNREVALKRIQPKYADDTSSRRRFLSEAEITARLDHPGVVPVFGLVADGNGRPCYAMRFIRGESLRDEILRYYQKPEATGEAGKTAPVPTLALPSSEDKRLAFRQLLHRFIAVCQAIGYAHTRNVIHRDIKPANVMVGSFGETLVVDWGLAKVLGEAANPDDPLHEAVKSESGKGQEVTVADDATAMGTAVGTPAYMAPEQAAGRIDVMGPRADIYSLGATLYYILTGQAPFGGTNLSETIRKVQLGEFVPPQIANPNAPKSLDAICRKAMAVRPEDRYATALELAEDVERWLSDEPVTCYAEPWYVRLGRWARRNPARVATAVSLLLTGLVATGIILFVVNGARRQTEHALEETRKARDEAATARDSAQIAEGKTRVALVQVQNEQTKTKLALEEAEAAREIARRRFGLARDTFALLVFDIQKELADRAGTQALREKLLLKARDGLEQVLKTAEEDKATDPAGADRLLFWARLQMGDVYRSMGRTADARTEYEQAAIVAERRVKANRPDDPDARLDMARLNDRRTDLAMQAGDSSAALSFCDAAISDWRAINTEQPGTVRKELAMCLDSRARVLLERGRTGEAKTATSEALEIRRDLAMSKDTSASRDLAQSLEREAEILRRLGKSAEALQQIDAAIALRQAVAKEFEAQADRTDVRRELAATFSQRGDIRFERGELEAALVDYLETLRTLDAALAVDPNSVGARSEKASVLGRIAQVQLRLGQAKEGLKSATDSLEISAALATSDPESAVAQRELATGHERLGDALLSNALPNEALGQFAAAQQILVKLATADNKSVRAKSDVARIVERIGLAKLDAGDADAAVDVLQDAVQTRRAAADADANSAEAVRQLATTLDRLAEAKLKSGDTIGAAAAAEESFTNYRRTLELDPTSRAVRRDLAGGFARWGEVADRLGKPTASLILLQDSTDEYGTLQSSDPTDVQAKADHASGLERLANVFKRAELGAARLDAETEAWHLREAVVEANPGSLIANRDLMISLRRMGDIALDDRNLPEARKWYAKAAAVAEKFGTDPIFASERATTADRMVLCEAIEKGQKAPLAVASYPLRIRGPALLALLEPGREGSIGFTERIAWQLADYIKARDAQGQLALAGLGWESLAPLALRNPEELYRLARAYAWCAARNPAGKQKDDYTGAALYYLQAATGAGFNDAIRVKTDRVWNELKESPHFPPAFRSADDKSEAK